MPINTERMLETFKTLVSIDNPSGQEQAIAEHLIKRCEALGMTCSHDAMFNVLAKLDGHGEPILFNAHTDSVAPCVGKQAVVRDGVVYSAGDTVLGADDLAGVTVFLEGIEAAQASGKPLRAVELLLTVQEEIGLKGARGFDYSQISAKQGIAFDLNGEVGKICIGSPAYHTFVATFRGRSAHAGVEPEKGINAIYVAAYAIATMELGRLDDETTANVGFVQGGKATNIVPDEVIVKGESRSRNEQKLANAMQQMRTAMENAAAQHEATVEIHEERRYGPSVLAPDAAIVQLVSQAMRDVGLEPELVVTGGGSDVSIIGNKGIEMANLAMGYENIHSVNESIPIVQMERAARLVERLLLG